MQQKLTELETVVQDLEDERVTAIYTQYTLLVFSELAYIYTATGIINSFVCHITLLIFLEVFTLKHFTKKA